MSLKHIKNQHQKRLNRHIRECCKCDCAYNKDSDCYLPQPCPLVDYFFKSLETVITDSINHIIYKIL
jgi:hypothetical protein